MIFIPFKLYINDIGGPSTFMKGFRKYLKQIDYSFIEDEKKYQEADIIFFPISFKKGILDFFKKNGYPIIQRLNGVYYPSKHGIKYLYFNRNIKRDYKKYSDFIIFQSEYSKKACFKMLGKIPETKYEIIYNGTDKRVFFPGKKKFNEKRIIFSTSGLFRNIDMLKSVILALDNIKKIYNIALNVLGPVTDEKVRTYMKRNYINSKGRMNKEELADEIRNSDIFIHCQLNPACPNSVIEAVSCGVPVVGFNTGAMKEVLSFSKETLAYVSKDIFQREEDFKYTRLEEKILFCINNYNKIKKKYENNSNLFNMNGVYKEYLKVFEAVKNIK